MIQQIKNQSKLPSIAYLANITSIWKGRGDKNDLANDRGVFTLTVLRMILDKVIYNEEYETIDKNMSDSNAGAQKEKNCRNHSFIVNGILHEKNMDKKSDPIDIHIYMMSNVALMKCGQLMLSMCCMTLEFKMIISVCCMKKLRNHLWQSTQAWAKLIVLR